MHITENLHAHWAQRLEVKGEMLADEQTDFQHVQIFDNAHFGRVMLLDGIVQITQRDEATYSEMLTHPAILELGSVRRVMIVGGGDGAIAEEVLKHPSIEHVDLVDIDGRVVELCRELFANVHNGAFDDARLCLRIEDAFEFLKGKEGEYDLIIADRPDPVGPAEILFETKFYTLIEGALRAGGIACFQTGVPMLQPEELKKTAKQLASVFDETGTYLTVTPTYVGGHMALTYGAKGARLGDGAQRKDVQARFNALSLNTSYYTPDVHFAAFALPHFVSKLL